MFKNTLKVESQQRLSEADGNKLRRTIREHFPNASDADVDSLLPPKGDKTVSKYTSGVLVYSIEGGDPMFFDIEGRGTKIFPTVYALWKVPELLPAFVLKRDEMSRFIIQGATLMLLGIDIPVAGLPSFSAGQTWAVKVAGNPAPIAVGSTTMSRTEALNRNLCGAALVMNHYYGDTLWKSIDNPYVPNAGFLEDVVKAVPAEASDSAETEATTDQGNVLQNEESNDVVDTKDVQDVMTEVSN